MEDGEKNWSEFIKISKLNLFLARPISWDDKAHISHGKTEK